MNVYLLSVDSMSLDQPVKAGSSQMNSPSNPALSESSSQEHSFTGKLAQPPREPDDILPSSSNDCLQAIKRNISTRLPGMSHHGVLLSGSVGTRGRNVLHDYRKLLPVS